MKGAFLIGNVSACQFDESFARFMFFASKRRLVSRLTLVALFLLAMTWLWPLPSLSFGQFQNFFAVAEDGPAFRKMPETENQLYGRTYYEQSMGNRINRVERTLFGTPQRGPLEGRMMNIERRMGEKNQQKVLTEQQPLIAYLEDKLFQRTYGNQPLVDRVRRLEVQVFGHAFENYPVPVRIKKLTYAMPLVAKEVRLTKPTSEGDMVVATTHQVSRMAPRVAPKVDMVQLDASNISMGAHPLPQSVSVSSGDYSQSVYREPSGEAMRWTALPIQVFIKAETPEYGLSLQALKAWQGAFSVKSVDSSSAADVIVTWDKATWDQNTTGLLTRPVVQVDDKHSIRTVILISMFPFRGMPQANQLHALSHQLGHAFGLWGHSEDPQDVMYPSLKQELNDFPSKWAWRSAHSNAKPPVAMAEDYHPSQRDINTLLKLYNQPANDLSEYSPY